jgi:cytochrome c oxidase cbb3-type subunit 3
MPMRLVQSAITTLCLLLCGCGAPEGGSTPAPPTSGLPSASAIAAVPMDHIAGMIDSTTLARSMPNPYAGNVQAIAAGKALYTKMNCAGCHAYNAKGNMGPDLTDTYWRYGGFPIDIYKSIHDGRAQGMPAWGAALPPQEIWKLVAYIQSFGGSLAANGTPHGVQRNDVIAREAAVYPDDSAAHASREHVAPAKGDSSALPPASVPPASATPAKSAAPPLTPPASSATSVQKPVPPLSPAGPASP